MEPTLQRDESTLFVGAIPTPGSNGERRRSRLRSRASQYPPALGGVTGVIGDQPVSFPISALT